MQVSHTGLTRFERANGLGFLFWSKAISVGHCGQMVGSNLAKISLENFPFTTVKICTKLWGLFRKTFFSLHLSYESVIFG